MPITHENPWVSATPEGYIKAEANGMDRFTIHRVTIDRQTGNVIDTNLDEGSREFRLLVSAARKFKAL